MIFKTLPLKKIYSWQSNIQNFIKTKKTLAEPVLRLPGVQQAMQHVNNLIVFVFFHPAREMPRWFFSLLFSTKKVGEQCILFHSIVDITFEMNPCVSFLRVVFILFQTIFSNIISRILEDNFQANVRLCSNQVLEPRRH